MANTPELHNHSQTKKGLQTILLFFYITISVLFSFFSSETKALQKVFAGSKQSIY